MSLAKYIPYWKVSHVAGNRTCQCEVKEVDFIHDES